MATTISTALTATVTLAATDNPLTITSTGSITAASGDGINAGSSTAWQIANFGSISATAASAAGIYFAGSGWTLNNSGSIVGNTAGIWASGGGTVVNNVGGLINGTTNYGVYVSGGPGVVYNAGTISAGWIAVNFTFASASNRLVVSPGAVFNGLVRGGGGILELAAPSAGTPTAGSIAGLSTTTSGSFQSFQTLVVDAGATWTLTGANTITTITDNGSLDITGALPAANVQIGAGGALEVASAPGTATPIAFQGTGVLKVDSAAAFGANVGTTNYVGPLIENFAPGDKIDIVNFSATGATFNYNAATGLLQIVNGASVASLDFQNSSLTGAFALASDGGTGVYLTTSTTPVVTEALAVDTGASSKDGITSNPALTGTDAANATITLTEGGVVLGVVTTGAAGIWNFTPTNLAQGANTIVASDGTTSASLTFTYDSIAPVVSESFNSGLLSGTGDPNAVVTLTEGLTVVGTTTANSSGVWTFAPTALSAGQHTIVANETDLAGNTGSSAPLTFTYTPPPVSIALVSDTGVSPTDGITNNDALTGTAAANTVVTLQEGATVLGTATVNASGVWNYTPTGLAQGAQTITAVDGSASTSLTFTYDTTPPVPIFTSTPPATGATSTATFTFGISNTETSVVYGYELDSATTWTVLSGASLTLSGLANGSHSLKLEAIDAAGNVSVTPASYAWFVGAGGLTVSTAITGPLTLTASSNPLAITATGSVTSTASGADGIDGASGTAWSVTNAGTVSSALRYGVALRGAGSSILNSGSISGYGGSAGYGVDIDAGGSLTNTSTGYITGGEDGIIVNGAVGTIDNSGQIVSTFDDAIGLFAGGSVINRVGGVIKAPTSGGYGPAAIYVPGGTGSIKNYGTISGQYGIYFTLSGTIENAGSISGTSGAIVFSKSSSANRLIVDPGATFNGTVKGGGGTLELAAGVGSIGAIGSSAFSGFQTLTVDAGATWTLTGTNTIANIVDLGSLVLQGALPATSVQLGAAGGGASLEVASAPATASPINFLGSSQLIVDSASLFGSKVGTSTYAGPLLEHFATGDSVDIHNFALANTQLNYSASSGLLQITNGAQVATLDFQNSTLGAGSFHAGLDAGGGGILVTIS